MKYKTKELKFHDFKFHGSEKHDFNFNGFPSFRNGEALFLPPSVTYTTSLPTLLKYLKNSGAIYQCRGSIISVIP